MGLSQDFDSIASQLTEIQEQSIAIRNQVMPTVREFGFGSPQMDSLDREIQHFDSVSLAIVTAIIDEHGWLSKRHIGKAANHTLFLAIQHAADHSVREKYFPLLRASAENGDSELSDMATMQDRMLVEEGELQLYGTQSKMVDGELVPFPIADPESVNKRRRKVGLGKMK